MSVSRSSRFCLQRNNPALNSNGVLPSIETSRAAKELPSPIRTVPSAPALPDPPETGLRAQQPVAAPPPVGNWLAPHPAPKTIQFDAAILVPAALGVKGPGYRRGRDGGVRGSGYGLDLHSTGKMIRASTPVIAWKQAQPALADASRAGRGSSRSRMVGLARRMALCYPRGRIAPRGSLL